MELEAISTCSQGAEATLINVRRNGSVSPRRHWSQLLLSKTIKRASACDALCKMDAHVFHRIRTLRDFII
jgi:hypothetical protein